MVTMLHSHFAEVNQQKFEQWLQNLELSQGQYVSTHPCLIDLDTDCSHLIWNTIWTVCFKGHARQHHQRRWIVTIWNVYYRFIGWNMFLLNLVLHERFYQKLLEVSQSPTSSWLKYVLLRGMYKGKDWDKR